MAEDVLERLKFIRDLPVGSPLPYDPAINNWAAFMSALCADAVTEIERLRRAEDEMFPK